MEDSLTIDFLAFRLLSVFFLMLGIQDIGGFGDMKDHGPHRVYSKGVPVDVDMDEADIDKMKHIMEQLLNGFNQLSMFKFQMYDLEFYKNASGGTVYASIYN